MYNRRGVAPKEYWLSFDRNRRRRAQKGPSTRGMSMSLSVQMIGQSASLGAHGIAMLVFTAVVFAIFVWDRLPITTVCLAILATLTLGFVLFPFATPSGEIEPTRFFQGFGHPALVAICALMIVGHALAVTGALEPVARRLAAMIGSRPGLALLALLVLPFLLSGLVNDTPVVVLLIPLIMAASARSGVAAGGMLLPMNYAVLIGGMSTTIGTSTNLIVVAIAAQLGVASFGLFSFYPLVLMASVPALFYLWLIAPLMLRGSVTTGEKLVEPVFNAELHVEADSWLAGKQLREVLGITKHRLPILSIRRKGHTLAKLPSLTLLVNDRIEIQDTAVKLKEVEGLLKSKLHQIPEDEEKVSADLKAQPVIAIIAQMIITPESPLVGRTIGEGRLSEQYGVIVVGIRSREALSHGKNAHLNARPLNAGDILLLQGSTDDIQEAQRRGLGLLLDARFTLPRQKKSATALVVIAVVVLLASTKILPVAVAGLAGVLILIMTRCLSWIDVG